MRTKIIWISFLMLILCDWFIADIPTWIIFVPLWGSVLFHCICIGIMALIYKIRK